MLIKRLVALFVALIMIFSLSACSDRPDDEIVEPTAPSEPESTEFVGEYISSSTEDLLLSIYIACNPNFTTSIWRLDSTDLKLMNSYTGIESVKRVEEASVMTLPDRNEPFSVVLIKFSNDANVDEMVEFLTKQAPVKQWGERIADDVCVVANKQFVLMVMMEKDMIEGFSADLFKTAFLNIDVDGTSNNADSNQEDAQ